MTSYTHLLLLKVYSRVDGFETVAGRSGTTIRTLTNYGAALWAISSSWVMPHEELSSHDTLLGNRRYSDFNHYCLPDGIVCHYMPRSKLLQKIIDMVCVYFVFEPLIRTFWLRGVKKEIRYIFWHNATHLLKCPCHTDGVVVECSTKFTSSCNKKVSFVGHYISAERRTLNAFKSMSADSFCSPPAG